NLYSVVCCWLDIMLFILKKNSYLLIKDDVLYVYYLKVVKKAKIDMKAINEFVFYESNRKVEIRINKRNVLTLYLKDKNKKKLLDWLVQNYPNIPCLFFNENETIG